MQPLLWHVYYIVFCCFASNSTTRAGSGIVPSCLTACCRLAGVQMVGGQMVLPGQLQGGQVMWHWFTSRLTSSETIIQAFLQGVLANGGKGHHSFGTFPRDGFPKLYFSH